MSGEKLLYTIPEAAALLSLPKNLIYDLINSGQLRALKPGKAWLISRRAMDEWIERAEQVTVEQTQKAS
jgi:excisionase family DNA binding protein